MRAMRTQGVEGNAAAAQSELRGLRVNTLRVCGIYRGRCDQAARTAKEAVVKNE